LMIGVLRMAARAVAAAFFLIAAAAMRKCTGNGCKVVGTIRRGCAAMAVDVKHPCGSFGWAIDSHLGRAENLSLRRCYEFGGKDCVVRAFA